MKTLVLGRNNIVNSSNSRFEYNFNPNIQIKNNSVALSSLIIPYSWQTVNSNYNNKTFQIIYNGTTYTLTLADGAYSVADINAFIQYWAIQQGILYCVSSNGSYIYFIEVVDNPITYSYEIRSYPTVLPSGATNPTGWTLNGFCPQFVVPSNNNFGKIIGVNAGSYPSVSNQNTNYVKSSDFAPSPSPINQIIVNCSLVNNDSLQSSSKSVIWSFSPTNTQYGENIVIQPAEYAFITCYDTNISSITVWLTDQDNNVVYLQDPNSLIQLLLRSN